MRDEIELLENHEIQPFGVNPASVESHQRYVEKFGFPFPLLSDPERAASGRYMALHADGRRIQRTVYLIDKEGVVRFGVRGTPALTDVVDALHAG